jgi:hypothetical protein
MAKQPTTFERCSCGKVVTTKGSARIHRAGSLHKNARRIRALLSTPCITLQNIGDRIGISRERVRQIARSVGIDTSNAARRSVCVVNKYNRLQATSYPKYAPRGLQEKIDNFRNRGWEIIVPLTKDKVSKRLSTKTLLVNGYTTQVSVISKAFRPDKKCHVYYYHTGKPRRKADFYIYHISPKNDTYIVPASYFEETSVENVYIPYARIENYNNIPQRNWSQWLENWGQLG